MYKEFEGTKCKITVDEKGAVGEETEWKDNKERWRSKVVVKVTKD